MFFPTLCYYVRRIKGKLIIGALFLAACVQMLIKPEPYLTAAESGLNLFLYSVLPTLVPFSFITSFLSYSGGAELLFKALKKPSAILFNGSGAAGYAFSLSLLSGYPVGAKTVTELYNCGCIGREEVSKIAAFTSTTGPLFVLGTVGVKFIGESAAAIILISHIAATVLNGVLFGRGGGAKEITIAADENYFSAFSKAVGATANAALSVAVCMIVFNVGAALMNETGVLNAAGYLLEKAFLPKGGGKAFATGLIEMTMGSKMLSESLPVNSAAPLITALVTFGGGSVHMQSMYFLNDAGMKYSKFFTLKLSQTILAYAISSLIFAFAV